MKMNLVENTPLYDATILHDIEWEPQDFKAVVSPKNPGENLVMRPLETGDYDRGFIHLLGQLTNVGDVTKEKYLERFAAMQKCKDCYYVTVIEDTTTGQLVAAASLVVELKFIHSCALRGRLEDVVVSDLYRGKQLGKLMVETITQLAKKVGCYKLSLDCRDEVIRFYEQLGYIKEEGKGNFLTIRFSD